MIRQKLSNDTYRVIARAVGSILGSFDIVRSIFIRRSVAAGEVVFGRSDIDFTILLNSPLGDPEEAGKLLALNRCYRVLRTLLPIVGESHVMTHEEMRLSYRADAYRGSLDRRAALVVYGKPLEIPKFTVPVEDSARRLTFWYHKYIPIAVRKRNLRNLRKFALEMWNAYSTATGLTVEPYITRRETESAWKDQKTGSSPAGPSGNVEEAFSECCRIAARLHKFLRSPLKNIQHPMVVSARKNRYVLIPSPEHPLPPESSAIDTVVCTPEILDLLVHYVSAFIYDDLPLQVEELGIRRPSHQEYVRSCWLGADPSNPRAPGFRNKSSYAVELALLLVRIQEALPYLQRGEIHPLPSISNRGGYWDSAPSLTDYYRNWYPVLYREAAEIRETLNEL